MVGFPINRYAGSLLLKFYEHRSEDAAALECTYRMVMVDAGTAL